MAATPAVTSLAMTDAYTHVRVDATVGAFTVYLPAAAGFTGQPVCISKTDSTSHGVTIAVAAGSGDALNVPSGANVLSAQWAVLRLRSTGTAWERAA